MTPRQTRDERDIVALLDGSLPPRRRAELEERLAHSPELRAALERQRRVLTALRSINEPAPEAVQARIAAERRRSAARTRRRQLVLGGATATVAAAVAVLALVLPGGGRAPTFAEAAALAERPAAKPAPGPAARNPRLLAASVAGVRFPNWGATLGWQPSGSRSDSIHDRDATTVSYRNAEGAEVAYTIVSGAASGPPDDARRVIRDGVEYHAFRRHGRHVIAWLEDDATCVVSSEDVGSRKLLALARW